MNRAYAVLDKLTSKVAIGFVVLAIILLPATVFSGGLNSHPTARSRTSASTGNADKSATISLAPIQSDDAVGYIVKPIAGPMQQWNGDVNGRYGDVGYGTYKMRSWAVWDVSRMQNDAIILSVIVRSYIWPPDDTDHTTQYRKLSSNPQAYSSASDIWNLLAGDIYAQFTTGTVDGYRSTSLGGTASADLRAAITTTDWFGIAITENGDSDGEALFAGWDQGMPELIIEWTAVVEAESVTWGSIKQLYE